MLSRFEIGKGLSPIGSAGPASSWLLSVTGLPPVICSQCHEVNPLPLGAGDALSPSLQPNMSAAEAEAEQDFNLEFWSKQDREFLATEMVKRRISKTDTRHEGWRQICAGLDLGEDARQPYCPRFLRMCNALADAVGGLDDEDFEQLMRVAVKPSEAAGEAPRKRLKHADEKDAEACLPTRQKFIIRLPMSPSAANSRKLASASSGFTPTFGPQPVGSPRSIHPV